MTSRQHALLVLAAALFIVASFAWAAFGGVA